LQRQTYRRNGIVCATRSPGKGKFIAKEICLFRSTPLYAVILLAAPHCAHAQSTEDNAVTQASDAFGRAVGSERTGLYGPDEVRGFNPIDAGNARIEGLYFDQIAPMSMRVIDGNTIRVGISAQGYPFPAPTGLVDYDLSAAGSRFQGNFDIDINQFAKSGGALELKVPLAGERFGISGGIGGRVFARPEGGTNKISNFGATLAWRPWTGAEVLVFTGGFNNLGEDARPTLFPAGDQLPPQIERRLLLSQEWTDRRFQVRNYGAVAKLPRGDWRLESGLFRVTRFWQGAFADLVTGVTPDGRASGRTIIADRNNFEGSTSGELRLVRAFGAGVVRHELTANFRGRMRDRRFGGTVAIPLGPSFVDRPDPLPAPVIVLGEDNTDEVRQSTFGAAYALNWRGHASLDLSIAKSNYRKTVTFADPARPAVVTRDYPLLWSAAGSVIVSRRLALYAGYVQGQEEAMIAPDIAVNRAEAPPAIRTRQFDAGLRFAVTPDLSLVAGVFSVTKPYFNLDPAKRYRQLGTIRNRGIELSLAGKIAPGLSVVAGTVLLDPRISGEAVDARLIGDRPVGQLRRRSIFNLDWRQGSGKGPLSIDFALQNLSARIANAANTLSAPGYSVVNVGGRYRLDAWGTKLLIRPQIENLFNSYGWQVSPSGGFTYTNDRVASIQLVVDF
jgi:iron complex outermembrane recepter protein